MLAELDGGAVGALADGLLDDAAVFPPGSADLVDAVIAHSRHRESWYSSMVGPLVLPVSALEAYAASDVSAEITLTFPNGPSALAETLEAADSTGVCVVGVEVALTGVEATSGAIGRLASVVAAHSRALDVSVEFPSGALTDEVLANLVGTPFKAKLRLGGVRAEMYPDEPELAEMIVRIVAAGASFKATAGLHHAVRNTDPHTNFEQHGFLNVLLAAAAAIRGASASHVVEILSEREPDIVSASVRELGAAGIHRAREIFRSFGTCSVEEPIRDLVTLGLVREPLDKNHLKGTP